ncbi:MAG TPA: patatin-like phospholipase family protein [Bryobacteraceae bacterium]|nr:patatin-like phospholipase family protein [Bryobacteraceae bacterium]
MTIVYHESVATALVLSAGALFAAWEVGVWKWLEPRFRPDLVVGASAGAWNAWAIAGGATAEELCRIWRDPQISRILQFGPHNTGLLRPDALHIAAQEMFESFRPRLPFACTLVELPSLRLRLFRGSEITWRHLAAACSIPFGFPPVTIDGRRYVDGGLRGALPLWAAEEMGATRAIAVNCLTSPMLAAVRLLFRAPQASRRLEVVRLEPATNLGPLRDALVWSAANIDRWIAQGERDAAALLGKDLSGCGLTA